MNSTHKDPAVAIAGGGPTGLMLACELALAGVAVTVLERRTEPQSFARCMVLHPRSVEALRARGVADRFVAEGGPKWPRTHFGLFYLDLADLPEDHYHVVPQSVTEQKLAEWAVELGVDVRGGAEVVGVDQDADGVTVTVAGGPDVRCGYLVACDGPTSRVAELAGFEFEVLAPPYYGAIADVPVFAGNTDRFDVGLYQNGQFAVLPLQDDLVRVMTVEFTGEPADEETPVTSQEVRDSVRRITGRAPEIEDPVWMTRYGYSTRVATTYRRDRVLVAGDAAHAHPPSSGDGLNTGIQDAVNLGWKLAAVVAGRGDAGLLDSYEAERLPVGRKACRRAQAQVALMHPLDQVEPLREIMDEIVRIPAVTTYLVRMLTDVRYPLPGDHRLIGTRVPDVTVETPDGARTVSKLMASGRGVLLDLSGVVDVATDRVDVVRAEPHAELDAETVLIRPDGCVAWAGPAEGLYVALKTWFG
ncbi:FAD-dependent monooxygenase [Streptomyces sp. NPDC102467]|uniref:FAD-dependent monooxygenase n=1 Tax=Streptomyces sp. NPDC102467 TaxID=3366179 RepID=UPI00381C716E